MITLSLITDQELIQDIAKRKCGCFEIRFENISFDFLGRGRIVLVLSKIVYGSCNNSARTKLTSAVSY